MQHSPSTAMQIHAPLAPAIRRRVGLAFLAFIVIGAVDGATGVLLPSIEGHYRIGKEVVSLLFVANTAGFLVSAFASGLLVALLGQRRFLMFGAVAFAAGTLVIGLRPPFTVVLVTAIMLGFGFAIIDAGLNAYIAALPENTTPLNTLHACYGAGGFLGPLVASGMLALGIVWNGVYLLWCACGLALIVGFALLYDATRPHAPPAEEEAGHVDLLTGVLRLGAVRLTALFMLLYVGTEVSLGSWSFSFLTEVRHHGTLIAGWSVSGYWLGITFGRLTLARLATRLHVSDQWLIASCLAGAGIGVLAVWLAPSPLVAATGLTLAGYSIGPIYPTTIALLPDFVPARLVASAVGFLAAFGSAGAALFPWLAGNLAQAVGLRSLMPYVLALIVVLSTVWLALVFRFPGGAQQTERP